MYRTIVLAPLVLGCASSSSRPASPPPPPQVIATPTGTLRVEGQSIAGGGNVVASLDSAWRGIIKVYNELQIEPTTFITDSRTIGNQAIKVRRTLGGTPLSRYIDCGAGTGVGPNADYYNVEMSVVSYLAARSPEVTEVQTRVAASATPLAVGSNPVQCVTTGTLESRIVRMLRERV